MNDGCLNCKDRKLGCHGKCSKYAEFKQCREEINKKHRQYLDGLGHDGCMVPKNGGKRYEYTKFRHYS